MQAEFKANLGGQLNNTLYIGDDSVKSFEMDKFIIIFLPYGQIEICMFSNPVQESDKEMKKSVIGIAIVGYE
jgi:hypothetical protein